MIERIYMLHGKARSGKNYTGEVLKEMLEARGKKVLICGFGDPVKDTMTRYWGITDFKSESGRSAIQHYATDVCRTKNPFVWAKILSLWLQAVEDLFDVIIIADLRFYTEHKQITYDWGDKSIIKTLNIIRAGDDWSDLTTSQLSHISETELDDSKIFDYNIYNAKDKDYLKEQLINII